MAIRKATTPVVVEDEEEPQIATVVTPATNPEHELVSVVMVRNVEPPPVIAGYNVGNELNIPMLKVGETYVLPKFVARVLIDRRAAHPQL